MAEHPGSAGSRTPVNHPSAAPDVGLFVTCLVDLMRPAIGFATVKLLQDAGCQVSVPAAQTCCGQPAYNSGDRKNTRAIAQQVIATFEAFEYVVVPSGSCGGMISHHYPSLFAADDPWKQRAEALADKTFELTVFLADIIKSSHIKAVYKSTATYHDSCSGLRELEIKDQPRDLMSAVVGLEVIEGEQAEVCCGFGGLFCVKYPDISESMLDQKIADIVATGAQLVTGGDLGCLMNIAGRLSRRGVATEVRHVAEVLVGMTDLPAIGAPEQVEN
ncbi:MAG: (Fe-S)-binding protein [Rhodospirillales bacterium]|nr:(Fe-S)-binding protein [Rhodospirillales bacterium]